MHPHNRHIEAYDFQKLVESHAELKAHIINPHKRETIDFSNAESVIELNTALLKLHYGVKSWEIPKGYLCPPIPSRVDYIHHLNDLLDTSDDHTTVKVLDVGTGASCIYPILGHSIYGWKFVGTETNSISLKFAQKNIDQNKLNNYIDLRFQKDPSAILDSVIKPHEHFAAALCNPPFYRDETEANKATKRKYQGLGIDKSAEERNFGGNASELWYRGGEKAFLHNYLFQSKSYAGQIEWFTSLVSKKENIETLKESHKKLKGNDFLVIPMAAGNKITRIVAWNF